MKSKDIQKKEVPGFFKLSGKVHTSTAVVLLTEEILQGLKNPSFLLLSTGEIIGFNPAWVKFSKENNGDLQYSALGKNFLGISAKASPSTNLNLDELLSETEKVLAQKSSSFAMLIDCHSPSENRWYEYVVKPVMWKFPKESSEFYIGEEHYKKLSTDRAPSEVVMVFLIEYIQVAKEDATEAIELALKKSKIDARARSDEQLLNITSTSGEDEGSFSFRDQSIISYWIQEHFKSQLDSWDVGFWARILTPSKIESAPYQNPSQHLASSSKEKEQHRYSWVLSPRAVQTWFDGVLQRQQLEHPKKFWTDEEIMSALNPESIKVMERFLLIATPQNESLHPNSQKGGGRVMRQDALLDQSVIIRKKSFTNTPAFVKINLRPLESKTLNNSWVAGTFIDLSSADLAQLGVREGHYENSTGKAQSAPGLSLSATAALSVRQSLAFSLLRNSSDFGVWTFGEKDQSLSWDSAMHEIYGFEEGEFDMAPESWTSCVHPEDRERVGEKFADLLNHKYVSDFQFRIIHKKTGQVRHIQASGMSSPQGNELVLVGLNKDITEEVNKGLYLNIVDNALHQLNDAVLVTEAQPLNPEVLYPKIVYSNDAFYALSSYSFEELRGQSPKVLQGKLSFTPVIKNINDHLKKWLPVNAHTINYRKDESLYWVQMNIKPIIGAQEWPTHWCAVESDITEDKTQEFLRLMSLNINKSIFDENTVSMADEKKHWLHSFENGIRQAINLTLAKSCFFLAPKSIDLSTAGDSECWRGIGGDKMGSISGSALSTSENTQILRFLTNAVAERLKILSALSGSGVNVHHTDTEKLYEFFDNYYKEQKIENQYFEAANNAHLLTLVQCMYEKYHALDDKTQVFSVNCQSFLKEHPKFLNLFGFSQWPSATDFVWVLNLKAPTAGSLMTFLYVNPVPLSDPSFDTMDLLQQEIFKGKLVKQNQKLGSTSIKSLAKPENWSPEQWVSRLDKTSSKLANGPLPADESPAVSTNGAFWNKKILLLKTVLLAMDQAYYNFERGEYFEEYQSVKEIELSKQYEHLKHALELLNSKSVSTQHKDQQKLLQKTLFGLSHDIMSPLGNQLLLLGTLSNNMKEIENRINNGQFSRKEFLKFTQEGRELISGLHESTQKATALLKKINHIANPNASSLVRAQKVSTHRLIKQLIHQCNIEYPRRFYSNVADILPILPRRSSSVMNQELLSVLVKKVNAVLFSRYIDTLKETHLPQEIALGSDAVNIECGIYFEKSEAAAKSVEAGSDNMSTGTLILCFKVLTNIAPSAHKQSSIFDAYFQDDQMRFPLQPNLELYGLYKEGLDVGVDLLYNFEPTPHLPQAGFHVISIALPYE